MWKLNVERLKKECQFVGEVENPDFFCFLNMNKFVLLVAFRHVFLII